MSFFIIALIVALLLTALLGVTHYEVMSIWRNVKRKKSFKKKFQKSSDPLSLGRAHDNPVLTQKEGWEREAVFNPAAIEDNGQVSLFYRALGADGVSRIGFASSSDGIHFDERLPYPVFSLEDSLDSVTRRFRLRRHPGLVASGGSWAGVEDPRAVILDGRLYLSFSAFAGWDSVRIGVTSISLEDFRKKQWNWTEPIFLSAPNEVHKNWVLFPEYINGRVAVLHSLHGPSRDEVLVDYIDSVAKQPHTYIKSSYAPVHAKGVWDSLLRGVGPSPIRTSRGWLTFYHATDEREPHKYKIGALLLDLTNPSKVIARSKRPILEPSAYYEEHGVKPGIVYSCGAVVREDVLTLYYGAADTSICAAAAPLAEFLKKLVDTRTPVLLPVPL